MIAPVITRIETTGDVAVQIIGLANDLLCVALGREPTLDDLTDCLAIAYGTTCGLMGAGGATVEMIEAKNRLSHMAAEGAMSEAISMTCGGRA